MKKQKWIIAWLWIGFPALLLAQVPGQPPMGQPPAGQPPVQNPPPGVPADPGLQPGVPAPVATRDPSAKLKKNDLINLDFVNADIAEITKSISELTKRNFILDDQVHGKITIISPKPVTVEEAYQAFISALAVKNYTVVPAGKMLKIVPLRDMKNNPIPTDVTGSAGGDDAFITKLIPLRYISATEMSKSLRNLVTKNGDVISYDPTNTLIITDAIGNLRRLEKIVRRLDQQGFQSSMEVLHLKYSSASDISDKLRQIFELDKQGQPQAGPNVPAQPGQQASSPDMTGSQFISKIIPDERTNSIIVMANQEGMRRVKEVVYAIDQSMADEIEKGRIHVHYLQYADATELVGTLSSLTGGGGAVGRKGKTATPTRNNRPAFTGAQPASVPPPPVPAPGGATSGGSATLFDGDVKLTADVPTNALVITATSGDYKSMLPVIRKLDIRRPQAFVEAMILEVDVDKALDVGVANHLGTQFGSNNDTTVFGATNFGDKSSIFLPTTPSAMQGFTFGLQGRTIDIPVAGGQSLTIPVYGSLFRALQTNGTINVLSTPNILTSDNKEAEIVVGQVVPFITAQGRDINNQPINQIQRENVAITLRVTPQINESDDVTMEIFQEVQDLVPGADINTFGPTTSNRTAKTSVVVKDGQTVTVGGLISDREQTSVSKVPVLGDIPLIGWFFKSKNRTKRKTSLAIFLTPHIIRAPEDLQDLSIRKNRERQKFLEENNVDEHPAIRKYNLDKSLSTPPNKVGVPTVPSDSPTGSFLSVPPPSPTPAAVPTVAPSLPTPVPPPVVPDLGPTVTPLPEQPPMEPATPTPSETPAMELLP
jgi:general secretion pathway protein D